MMVGYTLCLNEMDWRRMRAQILKPLHTNFFERREGIRRAVVLRKDYFLFPELHDKQAEDSSNL